MPTPDPGPVLRVSELRVSLTVKDHAALRAFYRDALGLDESQSWEFHGHGVVLEAGRATLELIDEEHAEFVDEVEVGERVAGPVRLAFAVEDAGEAAVRLVAAGAELLAEARPTPWGDVNARVRPPEGPQVTVFSPPPS
ncbi:VOC family protein [Nocardioides taihuensis]|uniref:VOC family protein n=1 Tax=Nocardioides taihuensis TaxID=1835606 RepID=A0ABW0BLJ8_9ACTN